MKLALLSRNGKLYSHARLAEAAQARGHKMDVIDHLKCLIDVKTGNPSVAYQSQALPTYDAVIPRIGASATYFGTVVLRQLEVMGIYSVNSSSGILKSRDKLRSLQLLSAEGIGLPHTVFTHRNDYPGEEIQRLGGAPVVLKLIEGTHGVGVMLLNTDSAAKSVMEAFGGVDTNILLQEFIKEANGEDIRCLVVGDQVIASMLRKGKDGEFRSNLHQGGSATIVDISDQERETAIGAARAMGLGVCGVDLLRSSRGPVVMEVNSSPGLKGIEQSTNIDVAGKIIEFIENQVTSS